MTLWKLGCKWGSNTPLYYDFIRTQEIVISWIDKPFQKNDWVLIANGHTVLAFAKVLETPVSCLTKPNYSEDFKKLEIPFEDNLIIASADWLVLKKEDQFKYKLQQGICRVKDANTRNIFNKILKKYTMNFQNESLIKLLKQKKQIILQGPPGTGKTRLAKELASLLCNKTNNEFKTSALLSDTYIASKLKNVSSIDSATQRTKYKIDNVENKKCRVTLLSTGTTYDISYNGIRKALKEKLWEKGEQKGGFDPYNAAIAKYLYDNKDSELVIPNNSNDYALIQFHPSYTYEDFVRGIVVKNNDGEIEYKTENKVLALIAEKALTNYTNHFKDNTAYNNDVKLKEYFNLFTDKVLDDIEEYNGFFKLTENIGLINVDDDAFRYKGQNEGWVKNGNRMLFKDILQAYSDGNKERQDIKKNAELSGLAKQHASYYVRVLNLFYEFLKDNNLSFNNIEVEKEPLNDYVLIIDEINRANLPTVLGELIYALEYRGKEVQSMYDIDGVNSITIPPNLYIIGTMNTADRSVGHIDYAIRRRFAFVDVLPKIIDDTELEGEKIFKSDKFKEVSKLFLTNFDDYNNDTNVLFVKSEYLSDEFRVEDMWLGHSYFIADNEEDFTFKMEYEIKPILKEYVKDGILNEDALDIINGL
jgi:5-methylcytosine-specific restriction endonuclease McrBC GTP-binding regulatory subunit McrB